MSRIRGEHLVAGALTVLMLLWLWQALELPHVIEGRPGSGFFPVYLALLGLILSTAILVGSLRSRPGVRARDAETEPVADPDPETEEGHSTSRRAEVTRLSGALLGLVAFMVALPVLGFVAGLTLYLLGLSIVVIRMRPVTAVAVCLGTMASVYVVFGYLLDVPFPTGAIGI